MLTVLSLILFVLKALELIKLTWFQCAIPMLAELLVGFLFIIVAVVLFFIKLKQ